VYIFLDWSREGKFAIELELIGYVNIIKKMAGALAF